MTSDRSHSRDDSSRLRDRALWKAVYALNADGTGETVDGSPTRRLARGRRPQKAIFGGYRPSWRSDRKPEQNDASVVLTIADALIAPGGEARAVLLPHRSDFWLDRVQIGDVLRGHEGSRVVAEAAVLQVEIAPNGAQAWWTAESVRPASADVPFTAARVFGTDPRR